MQKQTADTRTSTLVPRCPPAGKHVRHHWRIGAQRLITKAQSTPGRNKEKEESLCHDLAFGASYRWRLGACDHSLPAAVSQQFLNDAAVVDNGDRPTFRRDEFVLRIDAEQVK